METKHSAYVKIILEDVAIQYKQITHTIYLTYFKMQATARVVYLIEPQKE